MLAKLYAKSSLKQLQDEGKVLVGLQVRAPPCQPACMHVPCQHQCAPVSSV